MPHPLSPGEFHRITHLTSEVNYTFIHYIDAPSFLTSRTLSYCLARLPGLIRIHRNCAVNPAYVVEIRMRANRPVVLIGATELFFSHRRWRKSVSQLRAAMAKIG